MKATKSIFIGVMWFVCWFVITAIFFSGQNPDASEWHWYSLFTLFVLGGVGGALMARLAYQEEVRNKAYV